MIILISQIKQSYASGKSIHSITPALFSEHTKAMQRYIYKYSFKWKANKKGKNVSF